MNEIEDRYLGDGVYASYDGYLVWLDLRAQDSGIKIALDPRVLVKLGQYVKDIRLMHNDLKDGIEL